MPLIRPRFDGFGLLLSGGGVGGSAPPPSFTGLGDVSGWTTLYAYHSVRAMTAAIAAGGTTKSVQISSASGSGGTHDVLILSSGYVDIADAFSFAGTDATGTGAITGTTLTFTGGHTGDVVTGGTTLAGTFIVSGASPTWTVNQSQTVVSTTLTLTWGALVEKIYDQSGNSRDLTATNSGTRAQLVVGINGLPSLYAGGGQIYELNSGITINQPLTLTAVAKRTAISGTTTANIAGGYPVSVILFDGGFANTADVYAGGGGAMSATATDNVAHSFVGLINSTSSVLSVDGAEKADGTAIGTGATIQLSVLGNVATGWRLIGYWSEAAVNSAVAANLTQRNAAIANMRTAYGTP